MVRKVLETWKCHIIGYCREAHTGIHRSISYYIAAGQVQGFGFRFDRNGVLCLGYTEFIFLGA